MTRTRLAAWSGLAIVAILVACELIYLIGAQAPREYYDTQVYFQAAARPLGIEQFFYGKPAFVPLVHRAASSDPVTIAHLQAVLAVVAWTTLAVVLVCALRSRRARIAAGVACIALVLAGPRIGWTSALLSESINDSLTALVLAGAVALARVKRHRAALAAATGLVALAWLFTRDSNAITALVIVATAALVWPVRRWWRAARWAVALAGVLVAGALWSLYSTRVAPTPLPYQSLWNPALTARGSYPMVNNLLARVLPADRVWLAEQGAPVDQLASFDELDHALMARPEHAAMQAWLLAHGQATYVKWLLRHPIDRSLELAGAWDIVLAGYLRPMMPPGHVHKQHVAIDVFRRLTTNRWLVLALFLAAPWFARRPRQDALAGIVVIALASGVLGAAASYYGDASELARHTYGSGQQLVLASVLALLAFLDRRATPAPANASGTP